jgi:transmembrane 9 superfamily protein 2/4
MKVNKLSSHKDLLTMDYYRLPFCVPDGGPQMDNENLGEFLVGDRIESSPYRLKMKVDMYCEQVCVANLGRDEARGVSPNKMVRAIHESYHNNWIVDNLPAASKSEDAKKITTRYYMGFPIGFVGRDGISYVHNHVNLEVMYHPVETETEKYRVVRFTVEPFSIRHEFEEDIDGDDDDSTEDKDETKPYKVADINNAIRSCDPKYIGQEHTSWDFVTGGGHVPQPASGKALFTYDVMWIENAEVQWASRWDVYLSMDSAIPARIHWLSILNSIMIVAVLSTMIACILVRNLRRDIHRYNRVGQDEEAMAEDREEFGWKLVHADVFRAPNTNPLLLAVFCGTGAQLLCMTLLTIIFSAIGFLSPSSRGSLLMAQLLFYVLMGSVAGYTTARMYKSFKGKAWQKATALSSIFFPGICFALFLVLDIVAAAHGSTDAVPFGTLIVLLVLWFGISTPLVFFGAYFGYKQEGIEFPTQCSSIPRQVPDQPWYMGLLFTMVVGGILPFGACFVEMYFILASLWMDQYYYVFGFLFVVFMILIVTAAEITVLFNYFQLCGENYHWWWRSFCTSGSTAVWVLLYSFVYFKQLEANTLPTYLLYFGYMTLVSVGLFIMLGSVGVWSCLWFNKLIFSSIKVD